jgi:hypothetical protein
MSCNRTFSGRGFVSLANLIVLILLDAISDNGAFDSHSSRLRASRGAGVGIFLRAGAREEAIGKLRQTQVLLQGIRDAQEFGSAV